MTIAELDRYLASRKRVIEIEDKKRATFDYTLADLIGRSVARLYNSSNKMPTISEVYPSLFDKEEVEEQAQKKKQELFALRFKQFAQAHNAKFKKGGGQTE